MWFAHVVLDDGRRWWIEVPAKKAAELAVAGFAVRLL